MFVGERATFALSNGLESHTSREKSYRYVFGLRFRFSLFRIHCCILQGVLDGFNATVFAYGCTGAGKTYTMIGRGQESHQGIMVLTLQDLFKQQKRVRESRERKPRTHGECLNASLTYWQGNAVASKQMARFTSALTYIPLLAPLLVLPPKRRQAKHKADAIL